MINAYITGAFDEKTKTLSYEGVIEKEDGMKSRLKGTLSGSAPETQVSAVGVLLKVLVENRLDAVIYTDFVIAVSLVEGKVNALSKRSRDYVRYVKKAKNLIELSFVPDIPKEKRSVFNTGEQAGQSAVQNPFKKEKKQVATSVKWQKPAPKFRVVVYKADKSVLCDLDSYDFGGVLKDAMYFADWYEKEGKDKNSIFYGCQVERHNIPVSKKGKRK